MKLAIDATRNKSGGAIIHIISILKYFNPDDNNIKHIHLWSYKELLDKIPNYPWLVKHCPKQLQKGILNQLLWQYFTLPKEIIKNNCKLLYSVDAGSVCRFKPYITMSRDMLSFEKKELNRYYFSLSWLRLYLLKYVQLSSFKNSLSTIFLTEYAKNKIAEYQTVDYETVVINHGISDEFRIKKNNKLSLIKSDIINLTYVSNADLYKHNWNIIEAVYNLRKKYQLNIQLQLIGSKDGNSKSLFKIEEAIKKFDINNEFVLRTSKINHTELISFLEKSDIFVFASTCENMPNTLIEGMSTSLPIVCSNYGPMPEVIQDAAIYFDPENVNSICNAIYEMIQNDQLRIELSTKSYDLSTQFSWKKCSNETFEYIQNKMKNINNEK